MCIALPDDGPTNKGVHLQKTQEMALGGGVGVGARVSYSGTLFLLFHNVIIVHDKRNESIKWRIRHVVIPEI